MMESTVTSSPIDIPQTYFNGVQIGLTNSDVSLIMMCNGQPKMVANISFTTAKTLHNVLSQMIGALEGATGREIMTMDDIAKGLEKIQGQPMTAPESSVHG